jgi:multidrug efflux pump subunit AcrB
MNLSQLFVVKRPIAWTAMISVLAWGIYAYRMMPQRQDPIIPVVTGVILTPYPGAEADKVEQEVTRKIERKVNENPAVEHVKSISRPGLSIVYVELFESERHAELVWQDIRGKLGEITDLPSAGGQPTKPILNKDFGDSVAVMLTISSPPVSDLEIQRRAASIREAIGAHRRQLPTTAPAASTERWTGILVYPNTVARSHVLRMGRTLGQRLSETGVARDVAIVEAPSAGMLDVALSPGKTQDDLMQVVDQWERQATGSGEVHPDIWPGFWVQNLTDLETQLRLHARDKYTYRELKDYADRIRDRLKQSPRVAQIDEVGAQDERVWLTYSAQRLNQYNVTPQSIVSRIQQRNINIPGGRVELPRQNVVIRATGEYTSAAEIGQTVMALSPGGNPLYLRDLADITRGYEDPANVMSFRTLKVPKGYSSDQTGAAETGCEEGKVPQEYDLQTGRAITISVRQVKGTNIADYDRDLTEAITELRQTLPPDVHLERTSNEPQEVRHKIVSFDRNLIEAVIIVVLVSLVFMEWRSALLVAISIPVTVAFTLGLSQMVGIDLQQVSIAALIIALGLLVDAPVVAADAINRELAHGQPRHMAAWLGPRRLAHAVFYATLTNVVAFLPLLLVKGKTGDFIYSLPVVVSFSLVASMLVAWTFAPLLGFYMLKGQKGFEGHGGEGKPMKGFPRFYKAFVEACIAHRFRTAAIAILILIGGIMLVRSIGSSFFPKDLHNVFTVNLDLPEGSPIRKTREVALEAIRKMDALEGKNIRSYTTFIGAGGPRFWLSIEPEQRADNYAQILVHTASSEETAKIVSRLKEELPAQIAEARVRTQMLETGPPIGVPVQLRIFGPDTEQLRTLAAQVKQRLRAMPGTLDVHDDWGDPVFQMTMDIQPDRAAMTGLTHQDVATVVSTGLSGLSVSQLRELDKLIDIDLRLRPSERSQLEDLFSLDIASTATGVRLPLRQIASFQPEVVTPKIRRRDHERCITVRCDTVAGVLPSQVVEQLQKVLPAAAAYSSQGGAAASVSGLVAFPSGYRWEFGGEKFEQDKGFTSLTLALIVSFVAIYLALVVQFNSATQPLLVYAAVPFGIVAGLMGLLIMGSSFGFMAFLGVASLAGLIISHVIVLFDFIEEMKHKGEPLRQAVVDAGLARLRPVLTTVLATVGGLIPLAMEGGPLWEPMCYVQIAGMLVATLVTLVLVPVLYVIFVEDLRLVRWDQGSSQHEQHEQHGQHGQDEPGGHDGQDEQPTAASTPRMVPEPMHA